MSRERESKTVNMLETSGNTRIYALMRYIHVAMWLLFPKVMAVVSRFETVTHGGRNLWELCVQVRCSKIYVRRTGQHSQQRTG